MARWKFHHGRTSGGEVERLVDDQVKGRGPPDGLRGRQRLPVELGDERLTTVEAERRAREGGSRADVDSLAACVLLEAFLAARP